MKAIILIFSLTFLSFLSNAQSPEDPDDNSGSNEFCNGQITGSCLTTIGTTDITGSVGGDDGTDSFLFPIGLSSTLTFTYTNTGIDVRIREYTGTAGTSSAVSAGLGVMIASGNSFTFNPAKKYYLSVFNISSTGFNNSYNIAFTGGTLPVQLASFTGINVTNGVALEWRTSQEKNSKSFEVERSSDALNYKIIGTFDALGNSKIGKTYQFLDVNPIEGINYYRLKQTDFDNTINYLRPISVIFAREERDLVLYPNPSNKIIKLPTSFIQGSQRLNIYDSRGILVKNISVLNESNLNISVEDLPSGTYLIESVSENLNFGKRVKRFIKE